MKKTTKFECLLVLLLALVATPFNTQAQVSINVNTSSTIASNVSDKYGINLNAGVDHDVDRAAGSRTLSAAITETGSKRLRYPGGEKTNYFFWTADPMDPDPTTNYWTGSYADGARTTLNFDEFMTLCQETGAEAHVNVALSIWDTVTLNKTMAAEWVRYSNVTKGYNVKYWEIGNEMWHNSKQTQWAKFPLNVNSLAAKVIEYSNAMKAVDPTIQIGVSWKAHEAQQLINLCGDALDFIAISNYTNGGGTSYTNYKNGTNVDLLKVDESLTLPTVISEFNQADWTDSGWDLSNNTGKGLINFDLIGQILQSSKTAYGCLWNTRWYPDENGVYGGLKWDAVDNQNNLTAVAQPLALWEKFIKDDLVQISSGTTSVVAYAAYDKNNGDLNVILINKATSSLNIDLGITSLNNYAIGNVWQFKGNDEWDTAPTLAQLSAASVVNDAITYTLPSTSITVFSMAADNPNALVSPVEGGLYTTNGIDFEFNTSSATEYIYVYDQNWQEIAALSAPNFSFNYEPSTSGNATFHFEYNDANWTNIGNGNVNVTIEQGTPSETIDVSKTYYMVSPTHNLKIGANGAEDAFTTSLSATDQTVQWQLSESTTEGYYYIDCLGGGGKPRIRTDQSTVADMQAATSKGDWTKWLLEEVAGTSYYKLTTRGGTNPRLKVTSNGVVEMSTIASGGTNTYISFEEVGGGSSTIAVSGIQVSNQNGVMYTGNTVQLTATLTPSNATNQNKNWSSSNAAVATVNGSGLVTTVGVGTANITVTAVDGGFSATTTITVYNQVNALITPVEGGTYSSISPLEFIFTTAANTQYIYVYDANWNEVAFLTAPNFTFTHTPTITGNTKFHHQYRDASWGNMGDDAIVNVNISTSGTRMSANGEESAFNIDVFPNPSSDFVTIKSSNTESEVSLIMYNTTGQPLLSDTFIGSYNLSVTDLNKGVYILLITDQSGNQEQVKLLVE
ncbi:T9SS type A sorting domain-containing protein [Flammeovirga pectinis]|uniref:T9SS type A sorting domain-containing protein n=1 Tax=Flammeovirga pectinis TaxID=2494373 RepID=A0A3S9P9A0_9BACT|nr:Ig-like domain-containing protein [Flammeovirga pectinis]AZQ64769.1 T9SS type A sorting domain-containing protein [Flammeovirga pectinis]